MQYDLFDYLSKRSDIKCENKIIDIIVFFTCFRLMILCDEIHDFSSLFSDDKGKYILNQRLKQAETNIFNFITNFDIEQINNALLFVNSNYQTTELCYSFNPTQSKTPNSHIEIVNEFKKYVMNYRYFIFNIIIRYYKKKTTEPSNPMSLYITLLFQLSIIKNKSIYKSLNDNISKLFVIKVTRCVFGIINISDYNCDLKDQLANLLYINKNASFNQKLFIDQIGGTKSYASVLNTINSIINDKNFKNLELFSIELIKTNANKYDAAAPTSLENLINKISKFNNYKISVSTNVDLLPLEEQIEITFSNNIVIMKFQFISDDSDKISLHIDNYFGHELNYGYATRKSGGTKGNASKKKIESYILDQLYEEKKYDISSTDLSDLDKYLYNIAYKTMGDFLQILSVKIFEEQYKTQILLSDFNYNFITGDIICGYLGGIILNNSVLEKQLDEYYDLEDDSDFTDKITSYLPPNLSLTLFYNIAQFTGCINQYKNLNKGILSPNFKKELKKIYEKKNCMSIYLHKNPTDTITFKDFFYYPTWDKKFLYTLKLNMRIKFNKEKKSKITDKFIDKFIKNKANRAIRQLMLRRKTIEDKTNKQIKDKTTEQKEDKKIKEFLECINYEDLLTKILDEIPKGDSDDEKKIEKFINNIIQLILKELKKLKELKELRELDINKKIIELINQEKEETDLPHSIIHIIEREIKEIINRCKEKIIGGSSSGFGKYKKIIKREKNTKTKRRKSNKNQKYKENIIKLAKKYRISINKSTIKNIKNLQKLHKIAKKFKINITKKNKNGKRIYKTIKQLENEINKLKKLKKTNHKSQKKPKK